MARIRSGRCSIKRVMTDSGYGFRRRTASNELDGFSLEQLDWDVEARDVDYGARTQAIWTRWVYVNTEERKLIARDAQCRSVSFGEVAEGEPAAIVVEAGDDGYEAG